jgi:hypothetical protein
MKARTGRCEGRKPYGAMDGDQAIIARMAESPLRMKTPGEVRYYTWHLVKGVCVHPQLSVASPHGEKVMSRYTDAYRVARVIVGVGKVVKTLGIVAFLLMIVIGVGIDDAISPNSRRAWLAGAIVGGIVWLIAWVLGVIVSAQGQLLKANIDQAVNTSPFLLDDQRAKIMSLV